MNAKEWIAAFALQQRQEPPVSGPEVEHSFNVVRDVVEQHAHTLGQTVGRGFDRIGELVPVFIEHGLTTLTALTTPQDGSRKG